MIKRRGSLKQRLWFSILTIILSIFVLLYSVIYFDGEMLFWLPGIFLFASVGSFLLVDYFYRPFQSIMESVETGLNCFHDNDFSISIAEYDFPEFALSVQTYNELASILRKERMELHQRELLLDTVIQSTPMAIVLTTSHGDIVYSNLSAKKLLKQTHKVEGQNFNQLIANLPDELASATSKKQDGLYTEIIDDEKRVFYLTFQEFNLNAQIHHLYLYKNMTSEVNKEELQVWKKVIRLISHELNNSLAPIQSLTRSANKILDKNRGDEMLIDIFETIDRRAKHLHQFIEKYAKFSRLPDPNIKPVDMQKFIHNLENISQVKISADIRCQSIRFDATQMEQVMINLIKNARESDSDLNAIRVDIHSTQEHLVFCVMDRGKGMNEEQLKQSLLPFFTTKSNGSGLGLALCKEIISAHGGQLKLFNRQSGGLGVEFRLPLFNAKKL